MKQTLLDLTQDILSALDSDEVNSINDTPEAMQVARTIKTVYNDIISRANLPEHFDLFELNASGDVTKPTLMYRPANMQNMLWLKYDKRAASDTASNFLPVQYLTPEEFTDRMVNYGSQTQSDILSYNISTANASTIEITCLNNKAPDFYTSFDDNMLIFDSYDVTVDTTLMKSKTLCYGEYEPVFTMSDSFVPDLDSRQFSLLYNEAKALCFAELKQTENARAERAAKRGWVTLGHQKSSIPTNPSYRDTLPSYGKKRR